MGSTRCRCAQGRRRVGRVGWLEKKALRGAFAPLREAALNGANLSEQRRLLIEGVAAHRVDDDLLREVDQRLAVGIVLFELGDAWGSSRIGGVPQLPRRHTWPRDRTDAPLTFIASLDLAELMAPDPLPETGTLLVFWSDDGTRVFWVADGVPLTDAEAPPGTATAPSVQLTGFRMPVFSDTTGFPQAVTDDFSAELGPHQLLGAPRGIDSSELPGDGWTFLGQLSH